MLLDGAIIGRRGQHFVMRPGDSVPYEHVIVVPRKYHVLGADFQTIYDRFPIEPRIDVMLRSENGAVVLASDRLSIELEAYFGA